MSPKHSAEELTNLVEVLGSDKIYSLTQVCEICALEQTIVLNYIEYDVISPSSEDEQYFSQSAVDRLLKAFRLQRDLELNHAGVALALDLLDTIDELKLEVSRLKIVSAEFHY
jgi:chaperone modulatory protein CbpM